MTGSFHIGMGTWGSCLPFCNAFLLCGTVMPILWTLVPSCYCWRRFYAVCMCVCVCSVPAWEPLRLKGKWERRPDANPDMLMSCWGPAGPPFCPQGQVQPSCVCDTDKACFVCCEQVVWLTGTRSRGAGTVHQSCQHKQISGHIQAHCCVECILACLEEQWGILFHFFFVS